MRDRKIKVIGKGASASAVLAKYNGEEFVLKEILCKHWDEKGKKILKEVKILTIAYQYINFLDPTGASVCTIDRSLFQIFWLFPPRNV